MPTRLCIEPGCPSAATYRGRCQAHARHTERNTRRAGYHIYRTKRWRNTRLRQLRDHPLCQCDDPACTGIATDVDHIKDIQDGGDPWDPGNLRSLMHECHSRITRTSQILHSSR